MAVPVIVSVAPRHNGVPDIAAVTPVGTVLITRDAVVAEVLPQELLAVNV